MANLTATPGWDPVPQIETTTPLLGGPGGPLNAQAQALLNRLEEIKSADGSTSVGHGAATVGSVLDAYGSAVQALGDLAVTTGEALTAIDAKLGEMVSVMDFGAVGDGVADDTAAIVAAEAACAVGQELVFPSGTYKFTSPITITRQKPRWTAHGKVDLVYAGASATADLITVGDGVTEIVNPVIFGTFYLRSTTTMTAGTGLRLRRTVRGAISLMPQGQDNFQTYGNDLWNGVWFDETDNMGYYGQEVYAQNDGIRVSGAVGAGPKADLYLHYTKIAECAVGLHVGGAFGGLYTNHINLINNDTNAVFDQALAAETNREVFFIGGAIDVSTTGPGVYCNDAGGLLVQFAGTWIASSATHGIHVSTFGGKIILSGCRIFNCGGDGIRVDTTAPYVVIDGCQIHNNVGYGINPNIAAHKMSWPGVQVMANTAGNINLTNASAVDAELGYVTSPNIKATRIAFDANWYHQMQGGNPLTGYDANDFMIYDRTGNEYQFKIGGVTVMKIGGSFTTSMGLRVIEGSNAKQGASVLVGGTVTVANTSVTANSRILLTSNTDGGTPGFLRVSARTAGTSFTITSSSGADTSTVAWQIFEPA